MNKQASIEKFAVPSHVPPELVFDFDFMSPPGYEDDVQKAWWSVQQTMPEIFWTPRNEGHWVATRAEDIITIETDYERFSHEGLVVPRSALLFKTPPQHVDPPEHTAYRKLMMPLFIPRAIEAIEHNAREVAIAAIEKLAPRGECEFIEDFANIMPITAFLNLMQLPLEDRAALLPHAHAVTRGKTAEARQKGQAEVKAYLEKWVDQRTATPGNDPISHLSKGRIGDRPITRDEILNMSTLLMLGGLDTVASMLGFITRFLALNPGHRQQILDDPAIIPTAVEELMRRHGLVNLARAVTYDFVYKDIQFKAGDQIMIPNPLVGLDDRVNKNPLVVDFRRETPIRHATFSNGVHVCPGAVLARRELRIFLHEWLKRIPHFEVMAGTKPKLDSGSVNGVLELHLTWPV
jgi:cytochrome P450